MSGATFQASLGAADISSLMDRPETVAPARLRECPDCGLFQVVPPLAAGEVGRCLRCDGVLRRAQRDTLGRALALNMAAMVLLVVSCAATLLTVSSFGIVRATDVFTGPLGFWDDGIWELALVVGFMSTVAPFLRLLLLNYVLLALRLPHPPRHLRRMFSWAMKLGPWAMIDVYLLGVFVAYTEMPSMVHVDIGIALYALVALMVVSIAGAALLDRQAVWEEMERRGIPELEFDHADPAAAPVAGAMSCETCGLVCGPDSEGEHCPRCGSHMERRKPNAVARTWALLIASALLYIPANVLPVLSFQQFGSGSPNTIIGGARELLEAGLWPLALLVFLASIAVPCLKMISLAFLLIMTQFGSRWELKQRAQLYRIVATVGRWSMIDIFMESILVALVQFGTLISIGPGIGAIAFCAVVILTMFAAELFDPRLMWDAARDHATK